MCYNFPSPPPDPFARPLREPSAADGHQDDLPSHVPLQPVLLGPGDHPDPRLPQPGLPHTRINTLANPRFLVTQFQLVNVSARGCGWKKNLILKKKNKQTNPSWFSSKHTHEHAHKHTKRSCYICNGHPSHRQNPPGVNLAAVAIQRLYKGIVPTLTSDPEPGSTPPSRSC